MRRSARHLRSELHGKLDAALAMGTGGLVATAFLAVGREGLETALFVWASVHAASDGTPRPLIGVALGLATAVLVAGQLQLSVSLASAAMGATGCPARHTWPSTSATPSSRTAGTGPC